MTDKHPVDILFVHSIDFMFMGPMAIAAVLKQHGYTADILISSDEREIVARANSLPYRLIGFPTMWGEEKLVFRRARAIKASNPQAKIIMGGVYPTLRPEEAMSCEAVDYICRGEGDYPVLELITSIREGKEVRNIRNLWVRDRETIHKNPMRPFINLDEIPHFDVELYREYGHLFDSPSMVYKFSRGCPFACSFCYNELLRKCYNGLGKYIRAKSAKRVFEELKSIKEKKPLKTVALYDDNLLLHKEFLAEFGELIPALDIDMSAVGRADQVDEEAVELLKKCHVRCFAIAAETGDEDYRNRVLKKKITDQQIIEATRLLKKGGILVVSFNMTALPNETVDMALKTVDLHIKARVPLALSTFYIPFPKVELSELARTIYGLDSAFFDDLPIDSSEDPILPIENKKKIRNIQRFTTFIVRFPVFRPLLPFLIKLPPNPISELIYNIMRTYAMQKLLGMPFRLLLLYGFSIRRQEAKARRK